MASYENNVSKLEKWYQHSVRPFLERMGDPRLEEFDRDLSRLVTKADGLCRPFSACFVGGSGVGKSTLVNSLVGREQVIVPSGGVGPLTAQALKIEFGEKPSLRASYHAPQMLWRLIFALESIFGRELGKAAGTTATDLREGLDDEIVRDVDELRTSDDPEKAKKAEQYLKQAQLLVTGQQEGYPDKPYLIDTLREAIGKARKWGTTARKEDSARLSRLRRIFRKRDLGAENKFLLGEQGDEFALELRHHASGFLAPAIRALDISWNSDLLRSGLELVDLPGVGIAGDLHRSVTDDWMRGDANVVTLVVDHRGIRDTDAELLRASGFLNRLLHSADDPAADPVRLLIAVVKTDEIAEERRAQDRSKSKREHLADVMERCREVVRSQVQDRLQEAWSLSGGDLSETKQEIVGRLVANLSIFPVSSIQFRKLVSDDEDDLPFIKDEAESGIPQLAEGLLRLADQHKQDCETSFAESLTLFKNRLTSTLDLMRAQWEEGTRAEEEAEELRKQLAKFLKPLLRDFHSRQGQFRSFLKDTIPIQIEKLVTEARQAAAKAIRDYLRTLRNAHWATLRAAVRRGGTYFGARHIDLPRDFSQTFEGPIAENWSKTILNQVRGRTKEFANDCIESVEKMVDWTKEYGGRVQSKIVEAQRDAIRDDAKQLASVGLEMVNELRDRVRQDLVKAIEGPIRTKCKDFVARNQHVGDGVKHRILELFDELADEAIEAATAPAQQVLLDNYRTVEQEIGNVFQEHHNPLEAAEAAIVSSHEDYVRRSDAQKRRRVLDELGAVYAESPELFATPQLAAMEF